MLVNLSISFGKNVNRFSTESFILTESLHAPEMTIERHAHENDNLSLVLEGGFTETCGRRNYVAAPETLIIKPAGESHSNQYGKSGARTLLIEVKPECRQQISRQTKLLDGAAHLHGGRLPFYIRRIYKEFLTMDEASGLAIEGLLFEMFSQLRGGRYGISNRLMSSMRLRRARELIHEQFDSALRLSDVATAVGIQPSHLAREFRKNYHCTMGEYLRSVRLEHSLRLLTAADKSLTEIALAAGFYDQSHFCHAFRKQFRMTPTEYRSLQKRFGARSARSSSEES